MTEQPRDRITWLHVSDLHFEPEQSFDRRAVLEPLIACAREHRDEGDWVPDLVFATGDIANRGADREYERASAFFDELLDALKLGRDRLFVVPGNHDVDRTQGWLLHRTLGSEEDSDKFFAHADDRRHLAKLRAFKEWHASYFAGVHAADPFTVSASPTLVSVRGVRVGVIPMSSALFCLDDNDHGKLWVGRSWLHQAIERVREQAPEITIGLIHHPLDWLHDEERGQIKSELVKNIDVLLRGHLHDTEAEATASNRGGVLHLAAGASYQAPQWPKRALFARASVGDGQVVVRPLRYEKEPHRVWTLDTSVFPETAPRYEGRFSLRVRSPVEGEESRTLGANGRAAQTRARTRVAKHTRTYRVNVDDGITEVVVRLDDVTLLDELVLAVVAPPFGDVFGAGTAKVQSDDDEGEATVYRDELPDGRYRFRVVGHRRYASLEWRYSFSNALPLDRADAKRTRPGPWTPSLPEAHTGRPHTARFAADRLRIEYECAGGAPFVAGQAKLVAERWRDEPGREAWVPEKSATFEVGSTASSAFVEVAMPILGRRYTLACALSRAGAELPVESTRLAEEVLASCRGENPSDRGDFDDELTQKTEAELRPILGGALGERTSWLGLLWNEKRGLLLAAYGLFPNQSWSVRFAHGSGVAGHAFRFGRTATWFRGHDRERSLIYQPRPMPGGTYGYEYRWVVCVPIVVRIGGPAVGIVSFAGPEIETNADRRLSEFAQDAGRNSAKVQRFQEELLTAVNIGFWGTLAEASRASESVRAEAMRALEALGEAGPKSTHR